MNKVLIGFLCLLVIYSGYNFILDKISSDKNSFVENEPLQTIITRDSFEYKGFTIKPVAKYEIDARLLKKKRYWFGVESKLSPYDFAVGWGPMSQYEVLNHVKIRQGSRWYFYYYKDAFISKKDIGFHSSNMHLIPANKIIAQKMSQIREGQIIGMKGYLVNVTGKDGWHWNSSLSRSDRNDRACELMWVEEINTL